VAKRLCDLELGQYGCATVSDRSETVVRLPSAPLTIPGFRQCVTGTRGRLAVRPEQGYLVV
jgi:hypothetical protein